MSDIEVIPPAGEHPDLVVLVQQDYDDTKVLAVVPADRAAVILRQLNAEPELTSSGDFHTYTVPQLDRIEVRRTYVARVTYDLPSGRSDQHCTAHVWLPGLPDQDDGTRYWRADKVRHETGYSGVQMTPWVKLHGLATSSEGVEQAIALARERIEQYLAEHPELPQHAAGHAAQLDTGAPS